MTQAGRSITSKSLALFAIAIAAIVVAAVAGCSTNNPVLLATVNETASLPGGLPVNPLSWQVVTSEIDKSAGIMSTLFGNDQAIAYARSGPQHDYPAGSTLAMVTWTEREDPRWYGALIPDQIQSVEFIFVKPASEGGRTYQKFVGSPLRALTTLQDSAAKDRATYLLSQRAAVLP